MTEKEKAEQIVEKLKELVKKGNVARVKVTRNGEVLLNLPLNVGVVGGVIGLATAPWVMVAGVIAGAGLSCKVEVQMNGGDIVDLM